MPSDRGALRTVAITYCVLVSVLACWAWYVDIKLLHSEREHLLPDMLLACASMPTSLSLNWVYELWPKSFVGLLQTAYVTGCALVQATALFVVSRRWEQRSRHNQNRFPK